MQQLLNDIASAKVYANQREAVEAVFVARAPDLPEDAKPFHADGWLAAIRGVESADKLTKTFGASSVLKETVCTAGRLNQEALRTLIQSTETAFQQVSRMWTEQITFINLTNPGQQEIEPRKRIATELKACVGVASSEFETIASRLSKLLTVLKPGQAVPLERLPRDAKAIEQLRQAQSTIDRFNSFPIWHRTVK